MRLALIPSLSCALIAGTLTAQSVRPIADFTDAQTNVINFFEPQADASQIQLAHVDYAGVNARVAANFNVHFGTTITGSVTERPLMGGGVLVSVELHAKNAFSWVRGFGGGPFLIGHNLFNTVINGQTPALCESLLRTQFITTQANAPLPNLAQILFNPLPGQQVISLQLVANGSGPLRSAFGVAEGTPGRMSVTQVGLFRKTFGGAAADGFPVENVNVKAVGN